MAGAGAARVGIDVGGTTVKAGRVTLAGDVLAEDEIDVARGADAEAFLDAVAALARRLEVGSDVGIGVPGLLDFEAGRVLESPNLPWLDGVAIRSELAGRLGLADSGVHLENDANAAALGELAFGAGAGESDFLFVTLGTGIGGGLVLGGRLYRGAGLAGEIGHVTIDAAGPLCACGGIGCLETFASATAASRRARERGLPADDPGDVPLLTERARAGGEAERALLEEIGRDLGHGLAQALTLLDLRTFVVGGGFSAAFDVLEPGIRAGLRERSFGERVVGVRLRRAALGAAAGWMGAARRAFAGAGA